MAPTTWRCTTRSRPSSTRSARRSRCTTPSAGQVGAFGTVTHAVQVTQTPTLLIVNPHGQTTVLTGLTEAFAIQQAIAESHHS